MAKDKDALQKKRNKYNFLILIIFVASLGLYFWSIVRPKIVFTGCNEIALNTSNIQTRTSIRIDTTQAYEIALNDCLYQAGVDPLAE